MWHSELIYRRPLVVVLLTVGVVTLAFAFSFRPWSLGFERFTLEISSSKPEFVWLEPITLTVTLRNDSLWPATAHDGVGFVYPFISLFRILDDDTRRQIQPEFAGMPDHSFVSAVTLAPTETMSDTGVIYLDLNMDFPPGRYAIEARLRNYDDSREVIESNVLWFRVVEPRNQADIAAVTYLIGNGAADSLLACNKDDCEDLVYKHPDSIHAIYARSIVATRYLNQKQYDKVISFLEPIADVDFVWSDSNLAYLVEAYNALGNPGMAAKYMDMLETK